MPPSYFSAVASRVRDTSGISIFVALSIALVLTLIGAGVLSSVLGFQRTTIDIRQANAAYFAAEGGVELALLTLKKNNAGFTYTDGDTSCTGAAVPGTASGTCTDDALFRLVDFSDTEKALHSGSESFWRIYTRSPWFTSPPFSNNSFINDEPTSVSPNPFFIGNRDAALNFAEDEYGTISLFKQLVLPLSTEAPNGEYNFIDIDSLSLGGVFLFFPSQYGFDDSSASQLLPFGRAADDEDLMLWTLSGVSENEGYTVQGVIRESDFSENACDLQNGDNPLDFTADDEEEHCFFFDFSAVGSEGGAFAGEDISRTVVDATINGQNRLAGGITETFRMAGPGDFFDKLSTGSTTPDAATVQNPRLTLELVNRLDDTSDVSTQSIGYVVIYQSPEEQPSASDFDYIVSEGFSGRVKQTLEVTFDRGKTLSIFSKVLTQ